jgi:HK97 family phage portal protein
MEAYGGVGTLFAIVSRLANDVAAVEWKLYRKNRDGRRRYAYEGMDERTEITEHAAIKLLNKPNPFMTRQELFESVQQHVDLTGEGWLTVSYAQGFAGMPFELWPLRPDRMEIITDAQEYLTGYLYKTPDGQRVPLNREDVVQIRMPNPMDPYRGLGPVQSLMVDLDSARYSAEWNRNFFRNSAEPGGIIEVPEIMSDDDFRTMYTRWREQHQGVANAHRVAILENGKWVNRTFNMRDMQFAELKEVSDATIMKAFGFPKFMLGQVDDVNRATADAADLMYYRHLLRPRLERIKAALNNDLLPLFGDTGKGVEFDYNCEEPSDVAAENASLKMRVEALKILVDSGFNPEESTEVVGLPRLRYERPVRPGGDVPDPQNALVRWVARAKMDQNSCEPCKANDGQTYKSRTEAYEDYPGGSGYVRCTGGRYGNDCRCRVVKKGGENE